MVAERSFNYKILTHLFIIIFSYNEKKTFKSTK